MSACKYLNSLFQLWKDFEVLQNCYRKPALSVLLYNLYYDHDCTVGHFKTPVFMTSFLSIFVCFSLFPVQVLLPDVNTFIMPSIKYVVLC